MRVREIEQPFPWDEPAPAPGYFAPPSNLVVGNEWRLIQQLRDAAVGGSAMTLLTEAVVTQVQQALVPSPQGLDLALEWHLRIWRSLVAAPLATSSARFRRKAGPSRRRRWPSSRHRD